MTAPDIVDVLIVGAGPAGATAACILAARHCVVMVDHSSTPPLRIGESLIGAARPLLRDLGVLERFEAAGHQPGLGQASSWGTRDVVWRDSFLDVRGPGWRIDRARFETMLREAALERGAAIIAPAQALRFARAAGRSGGWIATVHAAEGTRQLIARFVIDASGRSASFARDAALTWRSAPDRLVCRFVRLPHPHERDEFERVSLVEAVADGWWYCASLPDNSRVLAFHTDADLPAARQSRDVEGFFSFLGETHTMAARVPRGIEGAVARVSARTQWLVDPCGDDWCAVGDAALAFDPLSSQGLFNALYGGLRGGEAVAAALAGDQAPLAAYRERLVMIRDAYRRNLRRTYQMELRFRDRLFWRRRQSPCDAALIVPPLCL